MAGQPGKPVVLTGLIRLREHCTFTWQQPEGREQRSAGVRTSHCPECIARLRELGYLIVAED